MFGYSCLQVHKDLRIEHDNDILRIENFSGLINCKKCFCSLRLLPVTCMYAHIYACSTVEQTSFKLSPFQEVFQQRYNHGLVTETNAHIPKANTPPQY